MYVDRGESFRAVEADGLRAKSRYKPHSEWIGVTAFRVKPAQGGNFLTDAMKESIKMQEAIGSHRQRKRSEASLPVNRTKMVCHATSRVGDTMENGMAITQNIPDHIYIYIYVYLSFTQWLSCSGAPGILSGASHTKK